MTALVVVHYVLFGFVHNAVDTRICIGYSPDPLFSLIPRDDRWFLVTRTLYEAVAYAATIAVFYQAFRGLHTAVLRWSIALCFMTTMRMATLLLIPLCRPTVQAFAPPPLASPMMLNLHFFSVPFRVYALNDVIYSGHTSLYILLLLCTNRWRSIYRVLLGLFLLVMVYGLIAARDHYSIDILLAIPCSYFADACARFLLRRAPAAA
ncbi:MAG: superfamily C-terminal [Thermoanaerobaculia bacterium]|jgi:hypothetical protein|nr:superfamily C-terminal [Thermoanaerobaculia bacterium]